MWGCLKFVLKSPTMKTQAYLEHANLSVHNLESTVEFIQTALPEFKVRGEGKWKGHRWLHIGTDDSYLALNDRVSTLPQAQTLNHLGFVVDDVEAVASRLIKAGYKRSFPKTLHPHRIRDYFLDESGTEYEFVQYLSSNPEERNDYSDLN